MSIPYVIEIPGPSDSISADILSNASGAKANIASKTSISSKAVGTKLEHLTYMQDVTQSVCSRTKANNAKNYNLIDRGDASKRYFIAKFTDGHCWMVQNLAVGSNSAVTALTTSYYNLNYNLPKGNLSTFTGSNAAIYMVTHVNNSYDSATNTGGFYTWCAATAGGCAGIAKYKNVAKTQNICPKNWSLPAMYNGSASSTGPLYNLYSNGSTFFSSFHVYHDVGYAVAGSYTGAGKDKWTYYWSSTGYGTNRDAYVIRVQYATSFYDIYAYNDTRNLGFSIRCYVD